MIEPCKKSLTSYSTLASYSIAPGFIDPSLKTSSTSTIKSDNRFITDFHCLSESMHSAARNTNRLGKNMELKIPGTF